MNADRAVKDPSLLPLVAELDVDVRCGLDRDTFSVGGFKEDVDEVDDTGEGLRRSGDPSCELQSVVDGSGESHSLFGSPVRFRTVEDAREDALDVVVVVVVDDDEAFLSPGMLSVGDTLLIPLIARFV